MAVAIPDYMALARQQAQFNNPNQVTPFGSRTTTYNPDGTATINTSLSPDQQTQFNNFNSLNTGIQNQSAQLLGQRFNPGDYTDQINRAADNAYQQQTRYLDPQFRQGESDMDSKLANQGIMPGSAAYDREKQNFGLQKTAAYGNAANQAVTQGNAMQNQLFGQGLQQHNSQFNDLASLKANNQFQMPSFMNTQPNVNLTGAAQLGYEGNLGNANAQAASNNNFNNGLFSIGSAALQNPGTYSALKDGYNWLMS